MTKPEEKDGVTKYQVYRRAGHVQFRVVSQILTCFQPIHLDLLALVAFADAPIQRYGRLSDARAVYPCTIYHNGRLGGLYTLYAETAQVRREWKAKLEEAIELRKVVQESNKVFEVETLSVDTFFAPTLMANAGPSWNNDGNFAGKATCSVPFSKWP